MAAMSLGNFQMQEVEIQKQHPRQRGLPFHMKLRMWVLLASGRTRQAKLLETLERRLKARPHEKITPRPF
jgi:hypothetical protein